MQWPICCRIEGKGTGIGVWDAGSSYFAVPSRKEPQAAPVRGHIYSKGALVCGNTQTDLNKLHSSKWESP